MSDIEKSSLVEVFLRRFYESVLHAVEKNLYVVELRPIFVLWRGWQSRVDYFKMESWPAFL